MKMYNWLDLYYAHYNRNNDVLVMLSFLQNKVYDDELTDSELSVIEALTHRVRERTGR